MDRRSLSVLLLLLVSIFIPASPVQAQDARWNDRFLNGETTQLNAEVSDIELFEGALIACGAFDHAGDTPLNSVACWTGERWIPFDNGFDVSNPAGRLCMTTFRGELYVGGQRWDGSAWSDVMGLDGAVLAQAVLDDRLYVGGHFETAQGAAMPKLAVWDGETMSAVPDAPDGFVSALLADSGELVVGGRFSRCGDVPVRNVAVLGGGQWRSLGDGVGGDVIFCCIDEYGTPATYSPVVRALARYRGELVAGGTFADAGGQEVRGLGAWDGAAWHPLSETQLSRTCLYDWGMQEYCFAVDVRSLLVVEDQLLVAGEFAAHYSSGLARWDGLQWSTDLMGPSSGPLYHTSRVNALISTDDGYAIGGRFSSVAYRDFRHVVFREDDDWIPTRERGWLGLDRPAVAVADYQGRTIVAGNFESAGEQEIPLIAEFIGDGWLPIPGAPTDLWCSSMLEYEGDLLVGGKFTGADVLRWDGAVWSALPDSSHFFQATAMCIHQGELVVGGSLHRSPVDPWSATSLPKADRYLGLGPTASVLRDGRWEELFEFGISYQMLCALASYDGDLVVGGYFDSIDGEAMGGLTLWDGSTFRRLENWPATGFVSSLAVQDGRLLVGGNYTLADGSSSDLAAWDGESWSGVAEISPQQDGAVWCVRPQPDGGLVIGGRFEAVDGIPARNLAQFIRGGWQPFGRGVVGHVVDAAVVGGGDLMVVGSIEWAGGHRSSGVALWSDLSVPLFVQDLTAARIGADAELSWVVSDPQDHGNFVVHRLEGGRASMVAMRAPGSSSYRVLDQAAPSSACDYRLSLDSGGNTTVLGQAHLAALTGPQKSTIVSVGPNPANPGTVIAFDAALPGEYRLEIFDAAGRAMTATVLQVRAPGRYEWSWNGRDDAARKAPSGIYLVRMSGGGSIDVRKMSLVR